MLNAVKHLLDFDNGIFALLRMTDGWYIFDANFLKPLVLSLFSVTLW
jgi:hypothetical protein